MRLNRDDHSDVDGDISKPHRPRRVEVLSGPERRRKWPDERKIAIVAETLEPGIVVSDVARRHELSPSQLFGWLKQFRNEAQALLDAKRPPERPVFAPAVVDTTPVAPHALPALLPSDRAPASIVATDIVAGIAPYTDFISRALSGITLLRHRFLQVCILRLRNARTAKRAETSGPLSAVHPKRWRVATSIGLWTGS